MIDKSLLPLTHRSIKKLSVEDRIAAVISDGMWYHKPKWIDKARVTEEELDQWIDKALLEDRLVASSNGISYRLSGKQLRKWYSSQGLSLDEQLFAKNFPPRIWDDLTETEGFIATPIKEIEGVAFSCMPEYALAVKERLKGIAIVKEVSPGSYRAFGLSCRYIEKIVSEEVGKQKVALKDRKVRLINYVKRRELLDFSEAFREGLVEFYVGFAKSLLSRSRDTISIFLPDEEDRNAQIVIWVLTAIEKFDESSAVPFSGYLDSVLKRWPYNLPIEALGKDLSSFQRAKKVAVDSIKKNKGVGYQPSNEEISAEMELTLEDFLDYDERNKLWQASINPGQLNWEEDGGEKLVEKNISGDMSRGASSEFNIERAVEGYCISHSAILAGIETGLYKDFVKLATIFSGELSGLEKEFSKINEDFVGCLRDNVSVKLPLMRSNFS